MEIDEDYIFLAKFLSAKIMADFFDYPHQRASHLKRRRRGHLKCRRRGQYNMPALAKPALPLLSTSSPMTKYNSLSTRTPTVIRQSQQNSGSASTLSGLLITTYTLTFLKFQRRSLTLSYTSRNKKTRWRKLRTWITKGNASMSR